jgi:hypothetical protein
MNAIHARSQLRYWPTRRGLVTTNPNGNAHDGRGQTGADSARTRPVARSHRTARASTHRTDRYCSSETISALTAVRVQTGRQRVRVLPADA